MPTTNSYNTQPAESFEPVLLHFKGLITDVRDESRKNRSNDNSTNYVIFDCAQIEVIEAKSPFLMPVYQLEIPWRPFPGTPSEAFKASVEKTGYSGDLNGLINKIAEWHYTTATLSLPKRDSTDENGNTIKGEGYEDRPGKCWQIVALEGVENTSDKLAEKLIDMADGKTLMEFKSLFMGDMSLQGLTGYQDVADLVLNNEFLNQMVNLHKKLTVDADGKYHKV